jgi:hypothetical protein
MCLMTWRALSISLYLGPIPGGSRRPQPPPPPPHPPHPHRPPLPPNSYQRFDTPEGRARDATPLPTDCRIMLATSKTAKLLNNRGFHMRLMTWRARSVTPCLCQERQRLAPRAVVARRLTAAVGRVCPARGAPPDLTKHSRAVTVVPAESGPVSQ